MFLPFFAYSGELVNYEVFVDYVLKGTGDEERGTRTAGHCSFKGPLQGTTTAANDVWVHIIFCAEVKRHAEDMVGGEVEFTAFTVRVGDRAASFFIDKSLAGTRNIKLLTSGQIRKIRDCCIFSVNDCEVFL